MDSNGCFQIICNIENFEKGMQNLITSLHGKVFVWTLWKRFALFKKWFRWFRNVTCSVSFKCLPRINFSSIWLKKLLHFYVIPFLFLAIKMTQQCVSSNVGKINNFFALPAFRFIVILWTYQSWFKFTFFQPLLIKHSLFYSFSTKTTH